VTGAALASGLALVQASSVDQFRILGVAPNLLLVMLVCWLVVRGLEDALPLVFVAGVTLGLVGLQPPGLVLLALLPIAAIGAVRELRLLHSEALLALLSVAVATAAYETVILLSVVADGGVLDLRTAFGEAVGPAIIVNVALAPFAYALMRLARPAPRLGRLAL
jgi:cell shape-determining protein MreD